jgi:hypothetical protein
MVGGLSGQEGESITNGLSGTSGARLREQDAPQDLSGIIKALFLNQSLKDRKIVPAIVLQVGRVGLCHTLHLSTPNRLLRQPPAR